MNLSFLIGITIGMFAALMMNIGKGVQKQKVHIFLEGWAAFSTENRKDLHIWLVGLSMTALAGVFFSLALKHSSSPSSVSAMTGVGLVGLTLYAIKVIGEHLRRIEAIGIGLVVIGTSALGYLGGTKALIEGLTDFSLKAPIVFLIFLIAILSCIGLFIKRFYGMAFGVASGILVGLALFIGDVALVVSDRSIIMQLFTPYPYLAMFIGTLGMLFTQIGFLRARALEVVPCVNSAIILTPLVLEVVIYGVMPDPESILFTLVIVTGVVFLSTGSAAKVSGSD